MSHGIYFTWVVSPVNLVLCCVLELASLAYSCRHQLQNPGQYSPLEAFYEDKKAVLPPGGNGLVTACPTSALGPIVNRCMHPEMKVCTQPHLSLLTFLKYSIKGCTVGNTVYLFKIVLLHY